MSQSSLMLKIRSLIIVSLLLTWANLYAQEDTIQQKRPAEPKIDSTQVKFFNKTFDSLTMGYIHYVDTNLLHATQFDPLSRGPFLFQTLSNAGLAHQPLLFSSAFNNGLDMNRTSFRQYLQNSENISFLDPTAALTELNYLMGGKKEQQLNVLFGRQIIPRLFIGMDFKLINSPGPYKNSGTNNTSVYFTARYNTINKRYGVIAHYFNNKIVADENGGILNDSDFENNLETDRRVIGVNLETASNKYKQSGFGLEQYFILLPELKKESDSLVIKRKFQIGRLTHQMEYQRNQTIYSETAPLADFYQPFDIVLDSNSTYDSTYQSVFRNRLQWSNLGYRSYNKDIAFHLYAGVELVNGQNNDSLTKRNIWQLNPYGGINIALFESFYIDGTAKLLTGNYASGDFELKGLVRQFLGTRDRNLGNLFFGLHLINQTPSWFYKEYTSNHFRWNQSLDKSTHLTFKGGYRFKTVEAGAEWHVLDKYVYLNTKARATQYSGTVSVLRIYSDIHLKPGKFDILATVNYQISGNDTVVRLPALAARLKIAFSQQLFKNAAIMQPGIEASWFTSYYANAYMPALGAFYIQNEKKIGNYPSVDVYLALKVKRTRIFIQYANILGLTGNYSYFTSPHYPMRDPRFYFGVSWRFYQ